MVRVKERYLLVNILYPKDGTTDTKSNGEEQPHFVAVRRPTQSDLTPQLLLRGIKSETQALFGDCGAGAVERTLSVKYFSRTTSTFILRITREHVRYVWTALTFMRHVPVRNGRPCVFRVSRVGGTIRKVEQEAIRQARALVLATKQHMAGNKTSAFELLTRSTGNNKQPKNLLTDVMSEDDDNGDEEDNFADFDDDNGEGMEDDGGASLEGE
ncbi:RNA-binding protein pop5 [Sporothrix stenoceras]|uniref:Ribonuclease P/MRP protein subunit POP5 n=1 Tax=Sporothrix stenoceras TaxID=5173 RepID=A0ABR3YR24_9PEZI